MNKSIKENVTDDNTRVLDDIVRTTKAKKDVGVRYMKSWEIEREIKEQGIKEGFEKGRAKERANTERERKRAETAEARVRELEAKLEKLAK